MSQPKPTTSSERVITTMIELARCTRLHRIVVAGSNSRYHVFELHRRGFNRVGTTAASSRPRGQFDIAFIDWQLHAIKTLETTLLWLVHFLAASSVIVIWIDSRQHTDHRNLRAALEQLGFRIEVGTCCGDGLAIVARRRDVTRQSMAA